MKYDFSAIEKKWQDRWEESKPYAAETGRGPFTYLSTIDTFDGIEFFLPLPIAFLLKKADEKIAELKVYIAYLEEGEGRK